MNKAKKSIIAIGLFFSVANVALKIIGNLLNGVAIALSPNLIWTSIFWFFGGVLIGYLVQKSRSKCISVAIQTRCNTALLSTKQAS